MNCNQEDHRKRKISVRGRKVCIEEDRRKADGCKIRTKEEEIMVMLENVIRTSLQDIHGYITSTFI